MERVHRRHRTSEFAPEEDFISTMPDNVITNILNRVPLQDAVSTGVLSSNWRFKWTMLTQLKFDNNFFHYLSEANGENKDHTRILSNILLQISGAITKCVLSVDDELDAQDIGHWILFLSRKGIKDLTIMNWDNTPLKLPTRMFSCLELKHLELVNCCLNPPPTFRGFPNLLSLNLAVELPRELGEFVTQCPLLETLELFNSVNAVQLAEISKLKNLKELHLRLSCPNNTTKTSVFNIFERLGSLSKLQELHLNFTNYKLTQGGAKKKLPASFLSLKTLNISGMSFSCAFELIKSCPSLQTLEIEANQRDADPISIPEGEYGEFDITRLQNVFFTCFAGSENEMCLIKYLLACSPFLKKVCIIPEASINPSYQLICATKLLNLPRASSVAKIDFDYHLY